MNWEFVRTRSNLHKLVPAEIFAPPAIITLTLQHSAHPPMMSPLFAVWAPHGSYLFCYMFFFFLRETNQQLTPLTNVPENCKDVHFPGCEFRKWTDPQPATNTMKTTQKSSGEIIWSVRYVKILINDDLFKM